MILKLNFPIFLTHPGALMVTTLRLSRVATIAAKGVMPGENWRPEAYMAALRLRLH